MSGDAASLGFKRRRSDADDAALYASILKRAQIAELQPACSALLNEQLTKAHGAVQSVAGAMQRLYEVKAAVEKLKSAQPQDDSSDGGSVEIMELLNSTEALQKQLSQQLIRLEVPEANAAHAASAMKPHAAIVKDESVVIKQERLSFAATTTENGGSSHAGSTSIIDLMSSDDEDEQDSGDDGDYDDDHRDASVKHEFEQKRDPSESTSTEPKKEKRAPMLVLAELVAKCAELAKGCPRTSIITANVVRMLRYLERIDAKLFTEHENASAILRALKKCLDGTVERILNESSSTLKEIGNGLTQLMTEMWLVAQQCPHVEAALSRRCERIQGITTVKDAPVTVVPIEETRKQWTELAKQCHSTTKDKLTPYVLSKTADRATWESVRKLIQGLLKKIIDNALAATIFLKPKHLKRLESGLEIFVQWAVDNPSPRERRDTRSDFVRQLKFAQGRCEAVRPYLTKSEATLKKVMIEETRTGECDLEMLRTSIQRTAEDLRARGGVPNKRFRTILRLVKFAAVRNQSPEWDPKAVPELKECVAILKKSARVVKNPHFHDVVLEELRVCEKALTE